MKKIYRSLIIVLSFLLLGCDISNDGNNSDNNESNQNEIIIKVENVVFTCTLIDNETSQAFLEMLPLSIQMNDLNRQEKYYNFNNNFPFSSTYKPDTIYEGDLMIWSGNTLVLFYETFSNSYGGYVKIGTFRGDFSIFRNNNSVNVNITSDKI